jgi:hypothetical protein
MSKAFLKFNWHKLRQAIRNIKNFNREMFGVMFCYREMIFDIKSLCFSILFYYSIVEAGLRACLIYLEQIHSAHPAHEPFTHTIRLWFNCANQLQSQVCQRGCRVSSQILWSSSAIIIQSTLKTPDLPLIIPDNISINPQGFTSVVPAYPYRRILTVLLTNP